LNEAQDILMKCKKNTVMNMKMQWKRGDLIGIGSCGKVYSGLNLKTGEIIAIKSVKVK